MVDKPSMIEVKASGSEGMMSVETTYSIARDVGADKPPDGLLTVVAVVNVVVVAAQPFEHEALTAEIRSVGWKSPNATWAGALMRG